MINPTSAANAIGQEEWTCRRCSRSGCLQIVTEAVITRSIVSTILVPDSVVANSAAQREADRRYKFALAMVKCPSCGSRSGGWQTAWLIASVLMIGLVVGLIGAIPGLIGALYFEKSFVAGALVGVLVVGGISALLTYRRRLADVDRWTRFPASDTD